jgi:hypothetical protein
MPSRRIRLIRSWDSGATTTTRVVVAVRAGVGWQGTVHPAWTGSDQRRRPIGVPCGHRNERPASLCALESMATVRAAIFAAELRL